MLSQPAEEDKQKLVVEEEDKEELLEDEDKQLLVEGEKEDLPTTNVDTKVKAEILDIHVSYMLGNTKMMAF